MSKYIVEVPEVHIQKIEIEATSFVEAIRKVSEGEGVELGDSEFYECGDPEDYSVWSEVDQAFKKGYELDL